MHEPYPSKSLQTQYIWLVMCILSCGRFSDTHVVEVRDPCVNFSLLQTLCVWIILQASFDHISFIVQLNVAEFVSLLLRERNEES